MRSANTKPCLNCEERVPTQFHACSHCGQAFAGRFVDLPAASAEQFCEQVNRQAQRIAACILAQRLDEAVELALLLSSDAVQRKKLAQSDKCPDLVDVAALPESKMPLEE